MRECDAEWPGTCFQASGIVTYFPISHFPISHILLIGHNPRGLSLAGFTLNFSVSQLLGDGNLIRIRQIQIYWFGLCPIRSINAWFTEALSCNPPYNCLIIMSPPSPHPKYPAKHPKCTFCRDGRKAITYFPKDLS